MSDKELLSLLESDSECGIAQARDKYSAYVYAIVRDKLSAYPSEDIEETVTATAGAAVLTNGFDGDPLSDISFEVTKNAELIPMKGDKGHTLEISKVGLYINGYARYAKIYTVEDCEFEDLKADIFTPTGSCVTIEYSDGRIIDPDDYCCLSKNIDLGSDEEYGINMIFSMPLDTEGITGITIKDEHFTVEQN